MRAERIDTRFATPVASPLPYPIAKDSLCKVIVEAVRVIPDEDDLDAIWGDNWIVRHHDPKRGMLRESTDYYATADQAYDAYWTGEVEWEAWVSPLFASREAA